MPNAEAERDARRSRLREVPPRKTDPAQWPQHIRPISIDEMDAFGVDRDGLIYWHGKPIEIKRKLELRTLELLLLGAATVGTLLQGIAAMFPFVPTAISKVLGY